MLIKVVISTLTPPLIQIFCINYLQVMPSILLSNAFSSSLTFTRVNSSEKESKLFSEATNDTQSLCGACELYLDEGLISSRYYTHAANK